MKIWSNCILKVSAEIEAGFGVWTQSSSLQLESVVLQWNRETSAGLQPSRAAGSWPSSLQLSCWLSHVPTSKGVKEGAAAMCHTQHCSVGLNMARAVFQMQTSVSGLWLMYFCWVLGPPSL